MMFQTPSKVRNQQISSMPSESVTIIDIAKRANVSTATVSRVINNTVAVKKEKREAVLEAMEKLNFRPNSLARGLVSGRSMSIGVLTQDIGSPFYDWVARGVIKGMAGTGYSPMLVDGLWQRKTESELIDALLGQRVDGLVLIGGTLPIEKLDKLREQTPVVVVARNLPTWQNQCVYLDNFEAARETTQHLIELGHRSIAHVMGTKTHDDAKQRFGGFEKAMQDAGLEVNPDLVFEGDFTPQAGVMAIHSFFASREHFTAVFAANDMTAFGIRHALHLKGIRVPEDISIAGFDDQHESAFMVPALTTFRQPAVEMGQAASQALLKIMGGGQAEIPKMKGELQVRQSTLRLH